MIDVVLPLAFTIDLMLVESDGTKLVFDTALVRPATDVIVVCPPIQL